MVQETKEAEKEYKKWKLLKDSQSEEENQDDVIVYREKISFHGSCTDPDRKVMDKVLLCFYPFDNSISMYNLSLNKLILHRIQSDFTSADFYVGARLLIYGRPVIIDDYADEYSKKKMATTAISLTFAIIKPSGMSNMGTILSHISSKGFVLIYCKMVHMTHAQTSQLYEQYRGSSELPFLMIHMTSGPCLALVLSNKNAIFALREIMGHRDPNEARAEDPCSIRARFGKNAVENAIDGAINEKCRDKEIELFFPDKEDLTKGIPPCASFKNPLLCLIKNHVIKEGFVGHLIKDIMTCGFNVTGIQMFLFNTATCCDFLSAYRGVISNFGGLLDELVSGPIIALEITIPKEDDPDFHSKFKKLVGPENPVVARLINPTSIRARYGHTSLKNAVYTTVLPIDSLLECSYFFNI